MTLGTGGFAGGIAKGRVLTKGATVPQYFTRARVFPVYLVIAGMSLVNIIQKNPQNEIMILCVELRDPMRPKEQ